MRKVVRCPLSSMEQIKQGEGQWGSRGQHSNANGLSWLLAVARLCRWCILDVKVWNGELLWISFWIMYKPERKIHSSQEGKSVCPVPRSHSRRTQWRDSCLIPITYKDFLSNEGIAPWNNALKLLDMHSSPWLGKARANSIELIIYYTYLQFTFANCKQMLGIRWHEGK